MINFELPSDANNYLYEHVRLLLSSFSRIAGRKLVDVDLESPDLGKTIFYGQFSLVSHNTLEDPVFNYGNQTALDLFEMSWQEFTSLPSRKSAETLNREERARLLKNVTEKGFIDDYTGIRISSSGKRFRIDNAIVWNVIDEQGIYHGQAAFFKDWIYV